MCGYSATGRFSRQTDAEDDRDDRDDVGEDRALDEELGHRRGRSAVSSRGRAQVALRGPACAASLARCGLTLRPGIAWSTPSTITRSSGLRPSVDDDQVARPACRSLTRPALDHVRAVDDQHVLALLIEADRIATGTSSAFAVRRLGTRTRTNKPGQHATVRVREDAAHLQGARGRRDAERGEVELARSCGYPSSSTGRRRPECFARRADGDGVRFDSLDDAQQIALVDGEVDVERIDLVDLWRASRLLAHRADQIARIDQMAADPAVEGRTDLRVAEVELGELHLGLRAQASAAAAAVALVVPADRPRSAVAASSLTSAV